MHTPRNPPPLEDIKELKETMTKMVGGDTALNDCKGTMNKISVVIPKIPQDSKVSKMMSNYRITLLSGYNSLSHPPTGYHREKSPT
ncbi:hypothetical protein RSOLAG1IB_11446 [Rhizoctonia solani AG-1 IB]|uniref:Uncharacterized protein n=1 Tax=Thanatephorus cucumeris (strain AG1-IB / isolate 7/3/14) TaxID=1108050 RepID=M5BZF8_THACB|nr:hypothetical protein BN14_06077 [Rhizoctonia solani AG-1 IB]CEL53710.1 hypothetical protein RSOLAG1IB_11446 [Rhizoctonia solani AG-1 IB]